MTTLFGQLPSNLVHLGNDWIFFHDNLHFPPIISSGVQTTGNQRSFCRQ
jgi:hypothetical protein